MNQPVALRFIFRHPTIQKKFSTRAIVFWDRLFASREREQRTWFQIPWRWTRPIQPPTPLFPPSAPLQPTSPHLVTQSLVPRLQVERPRTFFRHVTANAAHDVSPIRAGSIHKNSDLRNISHETRKQSKADRGLWSRFFFRKQNRNALVHGKQASAILPCQRLLIRRQPMLLQVCRCGQPKRLMRVRAAHQREEILKPVHAHKDQRTWPCPWTRYL